MSAPTDPAIARLPFGEEVDGRRLLAEAVGFGRALRAAGIAIDLGAAVDYARALTLVDMGHRETMRAAGEAVFVRRRDDREIYDRVFARWWRARRRRHPNDGPSIATEPPDDMAADGEDDLPRQSAPRDESGTQDGTVDGTPLPMSGGEESDDEADIDGQFGLGTDGADFALLNRAQELRLE